MQDVVHARMLAQTNTLYTYTGYARQVTRSELPHLVFTGQQ